MDFIKEYFGRAPGGPQRLDDDIRQVFDDHHRKMQTR